MQTRAYDNEEQGINRVVRSVLSFDACEQAAKALDTKALETALANRDTAKAEDIMKASVVFAKNIFDKTYNS